MSVPQHHFIEIVHGTWGLEVRFKCTATDDAVCHQTQTCECEHACDHEPEPGKTCWVKEWWADECGRECFEGPNDSPARSGPIKTWWNGDCLSWEYAPPAPDSEATARIIQEATQPHEL